MTERAVKADLLPFQTAILQEIYDPETSELVLIARGLGLRKLICTLLQICDSPDCLVLLVNASQEEEMGIGEELGLLGCRNPGLRIVGYEMGRKERQALYKKGGLISVTSQILVVDMLQSDIPTDLITGLVVLHAEKVNPLSLEAFIVRIYREKNPKGFLKAFSDQPEHITSGISPLKAVMKELQLRKVHIYPRFHESIKESLERRKADVVELYQPMTEYMSDIHHAIVQCMTSTLSELKRSNTTLDLDDFTVENSYFRAFDAIVRRQLDPVWHKVGPKTKQLVGDLSTLRNLLNYLLTYNALGFHSYLETIIQANTTSVSTGRARQNQSPWLYMDAANVIFTSAKRRCYVTIAPAKKNETLNDDEDEWDAIDEAEGLHGRKKKKKKWLPDNIEPILEEPPKWELLAEILVEIEQEILARPIHPLSPGSDTVLIMVGSSRAANDLREYLSRLPSEDIDDEKKKGQRGREMMESRLREYFIWKAALAKEKEKGKSTTASASQMEKEKESEALKMKDQKIQERNANRRRIRGGGVANGTDRKPVVTTNEKGKEVGGDGMIEFSMMSEADDLASFLDTQAEPGHSSLNPIDISEGAVIDLDIGEVSADFDIHFGIVPPDQTVLIRVYGDDSDDVMLSEIKPRYIVMYEPSHEFIRRIEVYRSMNPGLGVRVYFMLYHLSCEEHKYLAGLRKEKESFERLIAEKGSMVIPLNEPRHLSRNPDMMIKQISSRHAGGSKIVSDAPAQVIVDIREFRSTLPSLLHASMVQVIPATLTVGDYILSPDMCVERKSIPDLVQSFNSGRLYTQCELMCVHYKLPILLIEFEEHKSFSLQTVGNAKLQNNKYTSSSKNKPKNTSSTEDSSPSASIQAKLVLLVLHFPRVRIIWSSSPYATADIFRDLKTLHPEPSVEQAVLVGADTEQAGQGEAGASSAPSGAEDLLRCIPGITGKNVRHVMRGVSSVRALCEMSLAEVQSLLGSEPGRFCHEFLHRRK